MGARVKKTDASQDRMEELARDVASRTAEEVIRRLNLDNRTENSLGISKGDDDMLKRLRERIIVNGKERCLQAAACSSFVTIMFRP